MLWAIAVTLIILWLMELVTGYPMGYFIHIPLIFAIIAVLLQIEDDCNDYGSDHKRERHLKRQSIRRLRKILQKIAILPGEKVTEPIISPQTFRKE